MATIYGAITYGGWTYGAPAPRRDLPTIANIVPTFSRASVTPNNSQAVITNG
jgi:hypothetical protein